MRTAQDILENMEEEINRLRAELNNSKNFHCPHYLTNDSGGVSCHRDFEKEIASLKEQLVSKECNLCGGSDADINKYIDKLRKKLAREMAMVDLCARTGKLAIDTQRTRE